MNNHEQINQFAPNADQQALVQQMDAESRRPMYEAPRTDEALTSLKEVPGMYTAELMEPGESVTFRNESMVPTDYVREFKGGYGQEPLAVIRAGAPAGGESEGDDYLVSHVYNIKDKTSAIVVSRFGETTADTPVVQGIADEKGFVIGRGDEYQSASGLHTSRKHATVRTDKEGNITVDNHGVNGSEVIMLETAKAELEPHTVIKSLALKRSQERALDKREVAPRNPLVSAKATKIPVGHLNMLFKK